MSNIKEKIKSVLPGTHSSKEETGLGATTGATTTGYGVVGERERGGYEGEEGAYQTTGVATTTTGAATTGEAAACGRESFTKVEDRPRVIEQREYIKEHRPVEKEFVTETKFVGEREMAEGRTVEHLGTEERIIAQAQPKSPCE